MTYRATKLDPPRINESPEQLFKWRQRVFELLNGIQTILADGIEISPAPVGQIDGTSLQEAVEQLDALLTELQSGGYLQQNHNIYELEKRVASLEKLLVMEV